MPLFVFVLFVAFLVKWELLLLKNSLHSEENILKQKLNIALMSDNWSETAQMNVSRRQRREQKIDFFVQSTCDAVKCQSQLLGKCVMLLLEHFSQSWFHKHTLSSSNSVDKKWEKKWAGQFGNSPDFCVEPKRKESEGRALRKGGAVATEEEWNKWIWNAIWCYEVFFRGDGEHGAFHCAGLLYPKAG